MSNEQKNSDVILIGAGVMSATLGMLLKELAPDWKLTVFEKLAESGEESSNEWNNAGTGHAALCELNYTAEKEDGSIDITKALKINEQFLLSRQFWAYLVEHGLISNPKEFITPLPHMSYVHGEDNVRFLKKRFEALTSTHFFKEMIFSDSPEQLAEWMPLMFDDRIVDEPVAATKIDSGTDVNFGALTRMLFQQLQIQDVALHNQHKVQTIKRTSDGKWALKVKNLVTGAVEQHVAKFVFIGAGGGSLQLLQKTGIPQSKHIGGFPVSGLFMVCNNEEVVAQHHAKVYGKAALGAPPMSVPHLDTRFIDGKKSLLFGPFAGFTPKFLKEGSVLDLPASIKPNNITTMLAAGVKEMSLTKYLIQQLMLSKEKRLEELKDFVPGAKLEDWDLVTAGQRVQIIKDTEQGGKGTLQFGTEVVSSDDGSIAALLGASPGASTAVHVMLEVIEKCFPEQLKGWTPKLKAMIPSYGLSLLENEALFHDLHESTSVTLGLSEVAEQEVEEETRVLEPIS